MVNPGKNDEMSDEGGSLGRGKRKIKPRALFSPKIKGKTCGSKITTGVGFEQIKKTVVEREKDKILDQYAGAVYRTKRGVLDLVFNKGAPSFIGIISQEN